jgi:hypothetical protein
MPVCTLFFVSIEKAGRRNTVCCYLLLNYAEVTLVFDDIFQCNPKVKHILYYHKKYDTRTMPFWAKSILG